MPKRKEIDNALLLKLVKDGVPQSEIMAKMGFKTSTQLKTAVLNAYMGEGVIPKLVGGRGEGKAGAENTLKVNKRGSLVISKELVSSFGFKEGEEFTIRPAKYGLQVRRVGAEESTGSEE
jgi:hypothetical protein